MYLGNNLVNKYIFYMNIIFFVIYVNGENNDINDTINQLHSYDFDNLTLLETNTTFELPQMTSSSTNLGHQPIANNVTLSNTTEEQQTNLTLPKPVVCKDYNISDPVEIVNASRLLKLLISDTNITRKNQPADCIAVLFYGVACPFSSAAAAQYNALPRVFTHVKMVAIDAMTHHIFNAQHGIVGVPTLVLFHNGRPVGKYNETEYRIELLVKFIAQYTGITNIESLHYYVTSDDFRGPLSSTPEYQRDYCLGLSWFFIFLCSVYFFSKSKWCQWIIETIQNTWRESEAQHEHTE